jgi:hypothetical protein
MNSKSKEFTRALDEASIWKTSRAKEVEQRDKQEIDELRAQLLEYVEPAVFDELDITISTWFPLGAPWWRPERWPRATFDLPEGRGSVEVEWVDDSHFLVWVYEDTTPASMGSSSEELECGEATEVCTYEVPGGELQRELLIWYLESDWGRLPPIQDGD